MKGLAIVVERCDQLTVAGIAAKLPEERAAEALILLVGHLAGDGGRGIVAPPVVATVGVGGAANGAGGRAGVLDNLVVLDALVLTVVLLIQSLPLAARTTLVPGHALLRVSIASESSVCPIGETVSTCLHGVLNDLAVFFLNFFTQNELRGALPKRERI